MCGHCKLKWIKTSGLIHLQSFLAKQKLLLLLKFLEKKQCLNIFDWQLTDMTKKAWDKT